MKTKKPARQTVGKKNPSVGERIIEGLKEALAWSKGEDVPVRVTRVQVPEVDVSAVRRKMGLSQTQFALKFGFPAATLCNWEQGAFGLIPRRVSCRR